MSAFQQYRNENACWRHRWSAWGLAAFTGLSMCLFPALGAFAQDTAEKKNDPVWFKFCSDDPEAKVKGCVITQEVRDQGGRPVVAATVREIEGEEQKQFLLAVPPGVLLQPGLEVQIDEGTKYPVSFTICFPNACFAEEAIGAEFVGKLKKGNDLFVRAFNQQGQKITFKLTLAGFTKSYDGAPVDMKKLQAQQEQLQLELERRVREEREKLLEQQNKSQ